MGRTTRKTPVTTKIKSARAIRWVFPIPVDGVTQLTGSVVVGREPPSAPVLDSSEVSRKHARFDTDGAGWTTVIDLDSTNRIYLNGRPVKRAPLALGDVLRLGNYVGVVVELSMAKDDELPTSSGRRFGDWGTWSSPAMRRVLDRVTTFAADPQARCLTIEGEPGTESKALALAFHQSIRSRTRGKPRPFVPVDCRTLGNSAHKDLFGSWNGEAGARSMDGLVFAADNGTVFLEEVATLPPPVQLLVVKAIEAQEVGSIGPRMQFVLATSKPLAALVTKKVLQRELRTRLERTVVRIPPLRERRADIPGLIQRAAAATVPSEAMSFEPKLIEAMCFYDWPGNDRELKDVLKALFAARGPGEVLTRNHARQVLPNLLSRATSVAMESLPAPARAGASVVKVLFLASNPIGTTSLNIAREVRDIEERLRRQPTYVRFALTTEFAVRREDLIERIQQHKPTIVHFSGHGNDNGELIFETSEGEAAPAPVEALEKIFSVLARKGIRCVVLNACYSAKQAEAIARHVNCVVGMGHAVSDAAAINFASQFYSSIALGSSVHEAFELAGAQLELNRIPESDTPRLLCRTGVDPMAELLLG